MHNQRGATRRSWIKLFVTGWLHGSIRWQLTSAERGCFADLLCLAGECNHDGLICDNDGRPLPRDYLANHFNVELELLESTIIKCSAEGRLEDTDGLLRVINWKTYQSEYNRQKKYREKPVKNGKKKPYGQFKNVLLSDSENQKLRDKFGNQGADDRIEAMSEGIRSKGYKYRSHYAAILSWERRDKKAVQSGARQQRPGQLPDRESYTRPEDYGK